jgi:murein DD-endopeptidase MepM/ murein hydrolase activator NlpD
MYAGIPEGHPVDSAYPLTSPFGVRVHPVLNASMMHQGLDFGAPEGAPVRATADGIVRYTTGVLDSSSYGISVVLEHPVSPVMPDTFTTLYAHLSQARVWRGKKVKRGDIIGYVGNTGRSTDFHLHYEVHINGKPVDPAEFVLPEGQKPTYPPAITARRKTKGNQG